LKTLATAIAAILLSACAGRRGGTLPDDASGAPDPVFAEARALEDAGRFREAIDAYDAIRGASRDGRVRGTASYRIGLSYLGLGNPRLAREEFSRVADLTDEPAIVAPAYLEIGGVRVREKNWVMAESALARALEAGLDGDGAARAHYLIAVVCHESGRPAESRRHLALAGSYRPPAAEGIAVLPDPIAAAAEADAASAGPAASTAARPAVAFEFIPRSAWKASTSRSNSDPMGRVTRITIHHSGLMDGATEYAECANMVRKMQRQHVEDRGWADIGYHFVIDRMGRVWEGRPLFLQGAHAGNNDANQGNIGVTLSGDFDSQQPTSRQKASLRLVVESLMRTYKVTPSRIATHREVKQTFRLPMTECPGKHLQAYVNALRAELRAATSRSDEPTHASLPGR